MRPPIEEVRKALEEKRSSLLYGYTCHISQGTIVTLIALCDYALEQEAKVKEAQDA